MTIKADIRVATGKQYEYTSYFLEGTVESIREQEQEIRATYEHGEGLPNGQWNAIVDACLKSELKLSPESWERMSKNQQWFLQEIKKSRNRKPM